MHACILKTESFFKKFVASTTKIGSTTLSEDEISTSIDRYCKFLRLARDHPSVLLVPTLDIDLVWHAHMLHPAAYAHDCLAIVGRVFHHDDGDGMGAAEKLSQGLQKTAALWLAKYKEPYLPNSVAADSSCSGVSRAKLREREGAIMRVGVSMILGADNQV